MKTFSDSIFLLFPFFFFSNLDELSPPFSEQHNREQILISLEKFIQKEYDGMSQFKNWLPLLLYHLVLVSFTY